MRLRKFKFRQASEGEDEDLNITALIDIFTMLLFFLLTAAAFTRTTILELNLPTEDESPSPVASPATKESFSLTIAVTKNGFTIKDKEGKNNSIAFKNNNYDYDTLSLELKKIKDLSPEQKNVVLLLEPEILYEVIIKTMDHAREQIVKKDNQVKRYSLFPEISLADSVITP